MGFDFGKRFRKETLFIYLPIAVVLIGIGVYLITLEDDLYGWFCIGSGVVIFIGRAGRERFD